MRSLLLAAVCALAFLPARPCLAQAEGAAKPGPTPLQLALVRPVQLFSAKRDVFGLRLDLGAGDNDRVYGLDLGIVNFANEVAGLEVGAVNAISSPFAGVQIALLANWIDATGGDAFGLQAALLNFSSNVYGFQLGGMNVALRLFGTGTLRGAQAGVLNIAEEADGAQLGLVQIADEVRGLQLGLVNVSGGGAGLQLGVVNVCSGETSGLQVGVFNYCRHLRGLQLGVVNVIADGPVPVLPVLNLGL